MLLVAFGDRSSRHVLSLLLRADAHLEQHHAVVRLKRIAHDLLELLVRNGGAVIRYHRRGRFHFGVGLRLIHW